MLIESMLDKNIKYSKNGKVVKEGTLRSDWMTQCREKGISFQDLVNWYEEETGVNIRNLDGVSLGNYPKEFVDWVEKEFLSESKTPTPKKRESIKKSIDQDESVDKPDQVVKESVEVYSSSEHNPGFYDQPFLGWRREDPSGHSREYYDRNKFADKYYGYLTVRHPTLGDFYVSAGVDGDIRLDGKPWNFLSKPKYRLTQDQKDWINAHRDELSQFAKTGNVSIEIDESVDKLDKVVKESQVTDEIDPLFDKSKSSQLLSALKTFSNSALGLLDIIEDSGADMVISDDYPFDKSFDDLCVDIFSWKESLTELLAPYINKQ